MVARLLLLGALIIAGYLAWASLTGGTPVGCGAESGCDRALQSRWAYVGKVPVSLPAVGIYFALLVLVTFGRAPRPRWINRAVVALAVMIVAAALYFVGLQLLVIKSVCKFCMAAHACGLTGAGILLARPPDAAGFHSPVLRPAIAGLAGVFFLGTAQALFAPPQYQVTSGGASGLAAPGKARQLLLHDGRFALALDEVPIIGSPDAEHVVVCLFDYACSHCRLMHRVWAETQKRFGSQLAVVSLPTPLDQDCNQLLTKTKPAFE
ncbi:MAG: hypothetical protein GTO53_01595, partial [Planctomycetales bacterium]|nr:hypothetical protein [Planctomycetales bacterium]